MLVAIDDFIDGLAGARVAGFDETGKFHPRSASFGRQRLTNGAAHELRDGDSEGFGFFFCQRIFVFVQAYLSPNHVITTQIDDNRTYDASAACAGALLRSTPSHRATTAVARQLPRRFTDVRAMSISVSTPRITAM